MRTVALWLVLAATAAAQISATSFNGQQAFDYTRAVVAFGERVPGSAAHTGTENYILARLKQDRAEIQLDRFTAETPRGRLPMENIIAKFPGATAGATASIFLVAGHYDTKFLPHFVGANDGGSSTGLLLALADSLRGARLKSPIWLLFLDGEEAVNNWTAADSVYGSRHLAAEFQHEGLVPRMRALILVDMIGDKNLDIQRETNSTPWLLDFVGSAARRLGDSGYFFQTEMAVDDDHMPFLKVGIPSVDLIDFTYGPNDSVSPGKYWHTPQDTMDKLSAHSFQVVGAVVLETLRLLEAQS